LELGDAGSAEVSDFVALLGSSGFGKADGLVCSGELRRGRRLESPKLAAISPEFFQLLLQALNASNLRSCLCSGIVINLSNGSDGHYVVEQAQREAETEGGPPEAPVGCFGHSERDRSHG